MARLASSTRITPLSMNGPPHCSTEPGDVVPRRRRRLHPLAVGARRTSAPVALGVGEVGHLEAGRPAAGPGPAQQPSRLGDHAGELADHRRDVDPLGDLRAAPVPGVGERPVGGQDQPDGTGCPGALDAGDDGVAPAGPVGLEERLRVGGDDVLDRLAGERAEPDGDATRRGGPGDGDLAVGMDGLHAGRRDEHRHRDRLAHHRRRHARAGRAGRRRPAGSRARRRRRRCRPSSCLARSRRSARRRPTSAAPAGPAAGRRRPTRTTVHHVVTTALTLGGRGRITTRLGRRRSCLVSVRWRLAPAGVAGRLRRAVGRRGRSTCSAARSRRRGARRRVGGCAAGCARPGRPPAAPARPARSPAAFCASLRAVEAATSNVASTLVDVFWAC